MVMRNFQRKLKTKLYIISMFTIFFPLYLISKGSKQKHNNKYIASKPFTIY